MLLLVLLVRPLVDSRWVVGVARRDRPSPMHQPESTE